MWRCPSTTFSLMLTTSEPVGLQLLGNYFAEGALLHAAHALQQATDFHLQRPKA